MCARPRIVLAAVTLALSAGAAHAGPDPVSSCRRAAAVASQRSARVAACVPWKPRAWAPPVAATRASGLWVSRDPVDGLLGMPPAGVLSQAPRGGSLISDDTPVQIDHLPNGTLIAHLDDRWANFAMATRGPDGRPVWTCVTGPHGAAQFMVNPVFVTAPPTVKREDK
jgi:hypothetical protein